MEFKVLNDLIKRLYSEAFQGRGAGAIDDFQIKAGQLAGNGGKG